MDRKLDDANLRRAAAARPITRGGMFAIAAIMGAAVGLLAAHALLSRSPGPAARASPLLIGASI
jgi:hypothetical protein